MEQDIFILVSNGFNKDDFTNYILVAFLNGTELYLSDMAPTFPDTASSCQKEVGGLLATTWQAIFILPPGAIVNSIEVVTDNARVILTV